MASNGSVGNLNLCLSLCWVTSSVAEPTERYWMLQVTVFLLLGPACHGCVFESSVCSALQPRCHIQAQFAFSV